MNCFYFFNQPMSKTRGSNLFSSKLPLLLFLFCLPLFSTSQVVLNEIYPNGTVELKNIGDQTVDISSYWLCDFPDYLQLSDANLVCGNLLLEAGEIVAIDNFNTVDGADGEMGLYSSANFAAANAILDYVEWGSAGHVRASVAAQAGIWTEGTFVPAFSNELSLNYGGQGNTPEDWTAASPSICNLTSTYSAQLSGIQQTPSILTTATGSITAELIGNTLIISGSFNGLQGELATDLAGGTHVHSGLAGENGGIELLLTVDLGADLRSGIFNAEDNTFMLTNEQLQLLQNRGLYVNIHSTAFLSGELRGQLLPAAQAFFHATLLGSNQTPAVHSSAFGALLFELNGNELSVSGSFTGLSSKIAIELAGGAHIHDGMSGRNGPLIFPLQLDIKPDSVSASVAAVNNVFQLSEEQLISLQTQSYYINVHSLNFLPGELRGQILPLAPIVLRAELNGVSQTNPVNTVASGKLLFNYDGQNMLTVSGSFNELTSELNTDLAGGIHLHFGITGTNGDIALILNPSTSMDNRSGILRPEDNQFMIDSTLLAALLHREIYVNVHSIDVPAGELRGQVLPLAKSYLASNLSGLNQTTSVLAPSLGNIVAEVYDNIIVLSGSFDGLSDLIATDLAGGVHLHIAPADADGGIGFILNTTSDPDALGGDFKYTENIFEITPGQRDSLLAGDYYLNIHSLTYLAGELRGQLLREGNHFPSTEFSISSPADGAEINFSASQDEAIDISWQATTDPNEDLVVYTWQLAANELFDTPILSVKVGTDLSFSSTTNTLDAALASAGIVLNSTATTLYHRVLASDGCVATSSPIYSIEVLKNDVTSIQAIGQEMPQLSVYPNPVQEELALEFESASFEQATISIYNTIGILLDQFQIQLPNDQVISYNAASLSHGTYFIIIETEQARYKTSFIKMKVN